MLEDLTSPGVNESYHLTQEDPSFFGNHQQFIAILEKPQADFGHH